jgi:hypothetical protein
LLAVWLVVVLQTVGWTVAAAAAETETRGPDGWWKGNLHTHTLWSDGDDFPESIVDWYKTNGYHFLALSDHNVMQHGTRWVAVKGDSRTVAFDKYKARFGSDWVDERLTGGVLETRLKTLAEFRVLFEAKQRFLMIPSEEITDSFQKLPVHLNASNLREFIPPRGGTSVVDVMQRNIDAVMEQRERTGQAMFPHVNHPNFGWAMTAEDLMQVRNEQFFEVYNGHPAVRNRGDTHHVSLERMWDILLAFRLSRLNLGPLYGLAVDDAHNYHAFSGGKSNPGRGWVMVRASRLKPEALITAMEAGDFYASTGVSLKRLRRNEREISLEILPEPGVSYTTYFVGTLKGFDPTSRRRPPPAKGVRPVTRYYSREIGLILGKVSGLKARYEMAGDELYVRAKVVSTKPKRHPSFDGETEVAWIQPVVRD